MATSTVHDDDSLSEEQWCDPDNRIRVRSAGHERFLLFYVAGEIDYLTAEPFREYVLSRPSPAGNIILDLRDVKFCDSSGLGALVALWKAARGRRGNLVLSRPSPLCHRLLERTGLDRHIGISATLRHALDHVTAGRASFPPPGTVPKSRRDAS
ncbi:STAS domain-containing protein [Actinomadura formosensis]|uniref:STAS domain-containing protein n=1 Tax=Actinomadura formosensis TaxID=60706 RepID=UPI000A058F13|nr:STAS domain-containing protein [Actinomadura formosensis]